MSAVTRLLQRLEDLSDRLSPLVVKEARQLVRGREFILSFGLSLLVGLTVSALGAAAAAGGSTTPGRWTFALLMAGLSLLGLAVAPLGAFSTLRQERLEQTFDLITLTALSPRRIVIGKLLAQVVKLATLFAAIAPFIAMSFLLGGIDLATILLSLVALFMASVWANALFLLMSATSKSRVFSAIVFGAVAFIGLFGILIGQTLFRAASRGMMIGPVGAWVSGAVSWWTIAIAGTFWLATLINLVLLAENRLASATGDAVTPLRVGLLAQFLLIIGWALTSVGDLSLIRLATVRYLLAAGTIHLAVVSYFAVTEDLAVPRRVERRMRAASPWRWLLATFGPGGGRAAAYLIVQMCLLAATVVLLEPPAVQFRWLAAACGYICFFAGVPVLLFRALAPAHDTQLRRRVAVLLAVTAAIVAPDLVMYVIVQPDVLDITFGARHLINPFRSLYNWSAIEARGWVLVPSVMGIVGLVTWLRLIHLGTRAAATPAPALPGQPARVAEEAGRGDAIY